VDEVAVMAGVLAQEGGLDEFWRWEEGGLGEIEEMDRAVN